MKRIYALLLFLLLPLLIVPAVFAQELANGKFINVAENQTINQDYFATGEKVVVSGTINGDAYIFAGTVIVDGTINGDLITGGGSVNISGNVSDDVRVGGGQIDISGHIGKNLTAGGGTIHIADNAEIAGSLVAGGGNINIFAPLGKGATVGGGSITFADVINGNVTANVGSLALLEQAKINGDLNYWSQEKASFQNDTQVAGKTNFRQIEPKEKGESKGLNGVNYGFKFYSFLVTLIFGFLFIRFLPAFTTKAVESIKTKPLAMLGTGFLFVVLAPILGLILILTVVGIPFTLLLAVAYVTYLCLAKIFTAIYAGNLIAKYFNKKTTMLMSLVAGLVVYYLLAMLPILGFLTTLLFTLLGVGAMLTAKREIYNSLRTKKLL